MNDKRGVKGGLKKVGGRKWVSRIWMGPKADARLLPPSPYRVNLTEKCEGMGDIGKNDYLYLPPTSYHLLY